jgi:hypothetical protein
MITSMKRLERVARSQLDRLYEGTRRAAGAGLAADRRAVERVHELLAFSRSDDAEAHPRPTRRRPAGTAGPPGRGNR